MDLYAARPKQIRAKQWDGTRAAMYLLVGQILENGGNAGIKDGYESQGPDLINLQTRNGYVEVFPKDYVVKEGAYFTVMKPEEFEAVYEKAAIPAEPVMRDSVERSSISIQRDGV